MQSSWTRASGLVVLVVALTTALMLAPARIHTNRRDTRSARGGVQRLGQTDPGHDGEELAEMAAVRSAAASIADGWLPAEGAYTDTAGEHDSAAALAQHADVAGPFDLRRWRMADGFAPVRTLRRPAAAGRAPPLA